MPGQPRPRLEAISLFAGAGGTDVGLERAGWSTIFATDIDTDAVATLRLNQERRIPIRGRASEAHLQGSRIEQADIADLTRRDLKPPKAGENWRPALLAGGPPCQPWSSAGLQQGLKDPRGRLVDHMVRLTEELKPDFVLFENVRGLLTATGRVGRPGEVLEAIQSEFESVGYATTFSTLNAADYGAPQRRVRLLMIATAQHKLPPFPEPSHSRAPDSDSDRKPWISLGEALDALPPPSAEDVVTPTARRAAELADLRPGSGLRTGGKVENNRPSGHWGYRQDCFVADLSLPARTIRAASTHDWIPNEGGGLRRLTWRECAAIQGFPAEWVFSGGRTSRFRQIGNAVPSDVAEALGATIISALRAGPMTIAPKSAPWPDEFYRRVRYTAAEHRTNGHHRVRIRVAQSGHA